MSKAIGDATRPSRHPRHAAFVLHSDLLHAQQSLRPRCLELPGLHDRDRPQQHHGSQSRQWGHVDQPPGDGHEGSRRHDLRGPCCIELCDLGIEPTVHGVQFRLQRHKPQLRAAVERNHLLLAGGGEQDGGTTWGWSSVFSFTTSFTPQGPITIGFGLGTYQTLSFSSSTLTVTVGQSINFVPSFNTGGSNWQWFVNGSIVSTASSLSYTPSTPGTCQISVLVQYYGVLYSGSVTVTGKTHYGVALTLSGTVTTLAGSTAYGSVNGTGSAARFDYPMGITTDGTNLYGG